MAKKSIVDKKLHDFEYGVIFGSIGVTAFVLVLKNLKRLKKA